MKTFTVSIALAVALLFGMNVVASASQVEKYQEIATHSVEVLASGEVSDIASLKADQEKLMALGDEIIANARKNHPESADLIDFFVENIKHARHADLETIERDWHHFGAFKKAGIDYEKFDHYGPVIGAMDSILHPLTALVALEEFEKSKDTSLLEAAQGELEEILAHTEFLE